jgi:hypothetical protein
MLNDKIIKLEICNRYLLNHTDGESENIGDLSCNVSYHLSSSTENAA